MKTYAVLALLALSSCAKDDVHEDDLGAIDAAVSIDLAHASDASTPSDFATAPDLAVPRAHWILGYYAGYEASLLSVDAIAWSSLTHVAVAFYVPKTDGTLDTTLSQASAAQGAALAKSIVDAAHAHGRKALISIGGGASRTQWVAATSSAHLSTFVAALTSLLADPGFDGIDLDWEPVDYKNDGAPMKALVDALRKAAPTTLLTMPVAPLNTNAPPDLSMYASFGSELDQINIMSYGMAGAFPGWKSWHSSALYQSDAAAPESVDGSVATYLKAGIDVKHLGVGTGAYALCYTSPVTAPLQALGSSSVSSSNLSYAIITTGYEPLGTKSYDAAAHVPYLTLPSDEGPTGSPKCRYLSYEDPQSVADKAAYVNDKGLGGVIVWTLGKGHVSSTGSNDPLLDAYANTL